MFNMVEEILKKLVVQIPLMKLISMNNLIMWFYAQHRTTSILENFKRYKNEKEG